MSSGNPDTRKKILDACWALLESAGGREVRMSDIARRAGVSRQAVYLHFPARVDLLIATTDHIDAVNEVDARLAPSRAAATGEARLAAFIEAWGNYIPLIHPVARALIHAGATDPAAAEAWQSRLALIRSGCHAAVAALARDGRLAPGPEPDEAADILAALLSVESWAYLVQGRGWSQARYVEGMQRTARRILVAGEAG